MSQSKFNLRLPRHLAGRAAAGSVFVECGLEAGGEEGSPRRLEAELVDFSRFGACFRLDRSLDVGHPVRLRICEPKSTFEVTMAGQIRWSLVDDDGLWSHGMLFQEQVSWETFGELFLREIISADEVPAAPRPMLSFGPTRP